MRAVRDARRVLYSHALASVAIMLPWPALLLITWSQTANPTLLGLVGAARLAPFVVFALPGGLLADRVPRLTLFRWSVGVRAVLLCIAGALIIQDWLWPAVVVATLAVVAATPSYPAAVAFTAQQDGSDSGRFVAGLVTIEVSSFVVGPAVGGLLIATLGTRPAVASAGVVALAAYLPLARLGRSPSTEEQVSRPDDRVRLRAVLALPDVARYLALMAVVNALQAAAAVSLVELSASAWSAGDRGFGWAAAGLGFGALAAPAMVATTSRPGRLLLCLAPAYLIVAIAPGVETALLPLICVGTATTALEVVATQSLQQRIPDSVRASTLGLANTLMVAVSLVAAAAAPFVSSSLTGPRLFFGLLGVAAFATIVVSRGQRHHRRSLLDAYRHVFAIHDVPGMATRLKHEGLPAVDADASMAESGHSRGSTGRPILFPDLRGSR